MFVRDLTDYNMRLTRYWTAYQHCKTDSDMPTKPWPDYRRRGLHCSRILQWRTTVCLLMLKLVWAWGKTSHQMLRLWGPYTACLALPTRLTWLHWPALIGRHVDYWLLPISFSNFGFLWLELCAFFKYYYYYYYFLQCFCSLMNFWTNNNNSA